MEADPLYHTKQLFYQSSFQACIASASEFLHTPPTDDLESPEDALGRAVYIARAHLALSPPEFNQARAVLSPWLNGESPALQARAVDIFAQYLAAPGEEKVEEIRDVVLECEGEAGEALVRAVAGGLFVLAGEKEEAVATLTEGAAKEDLECIAILVQLLLSLNRRDLALQTYTAAKRIGNDSMLIQAIEAWIGLKSGAQPLHQSFYFYEELYQLPSGRTPPVLAAHAGAHLLLGEREEAEEDVKEGLKSGGANGKGDLVGVGASLGLKDFAAKLQETEPAHPYAIDLAEKASAFDEAAKKWAVAA
ncbi:hypothetical protein IAR50_002341 [Cryptococcus sp. DSM 104548]